MKIALLGNPNTGKSSVFNLLTGLRQRVGNFPGVTVDKKIGKISFGGNDHSLIDFPGTYSIHPRSLDEKVVWEALSDSEHADHPDVNVVVIDSSNLERNLLLFSQVYDLGLPTVMTLNMSDVAYRHGVKLNLDELQELFPETSIVQMNARLNSGKKPLLEAIEKAPDRSGSSFVGQVPNPENEVEFKQDLEKRIKRIAEHIDQLQTVESKEDTRSEKIDRILTHPILGYVIFIGLLLVVFQFIYAFADVPMSLIDSGFAQLSSWLSAVMPEGVFSDLITQGVIPGIGGVVIFIPQIAILFFFLSIMEESGYLARVVYMMDRLMRPLGLNGKSMVPLMSSIACAIPGVMSARTISNWKERMITIMVAPLMSCSARIPVYTILIALVIPDENYGIMNLQGIALLGLYLLGTVAALLIAFVMKWFIKSREKGFLLLELPGYKSPRWKNVGITVWEKVRIFVVDAGKIILAISIILWALGTYGPSDYMEHARENALSVAQAEGLSDEETNRMVASAELENSYIGIMGKSIEPVIEPLGYDWKIGISLIASFAAREVFVGSLATIYAVEYEEDAPGPLLYRMRAEKRPDGSPIYSFAAGMSLMVFFAFAMQCMSTLAVVKRETRSWKWPLIQLGYMGVLAYLASWITFITLS